MKTYLTSLWQLLFPNLCVACGNPLVTGEQTVCLQCLYAIARTHYATKADNPIEQLFWGKVEIEKATAWGHFSKGGTLQALLHALKYKNKPQVGYVLGEQFAVENATWLQNIDVLLPIPLHQKRLRSRGYNQAACIAQGITKQTNIPLSEEVLIRNVSTQTQTQKRVFERWQNTQGVFSLQNTHGLQGKHVLLIADVIPTGATLASAAITLKQNIPNITISIAAIAVAST